MTLSSTSTSTTTTREEIQPYDETDPRFRDGFAYYLELARSVDRGVDTFGNANIRLGTDLATCYFEQGFPGMVNQIPSNLTSFLNKNGIYSLDITVKEAFMSSAWHDVIKRLEESYSHLAIEANNLLYHRRSPEAKTNVDSLKASLRWAQQNPTAIPVDMMRDVISSMDKTKNTIQREAIHTGIALEPPQTEVEKTRMDALEKREQQVKTPRYTIEEIHKQRQEIVKEGLKAVIDIFTTMHDKTITEIPIQSDEEAYMIRDGFIALANNYTSMDDDKHRMDFATWAKILENIEKYGPEKGLKMSAVEITPEDIKMVDPSTLPLNFYPKYDKIGLSYISKEHLDSKGIIIANCFINMMNQMAWHEATARLFSYKAKIRGIRAIAVSDKLMGSPSQAQPQRA